MDRHIPDNSRLVDLVLRRINMWPFKDSKYPTKDFSNLEHIPQLGDCILIHDLRPNIIGAGIEWFEGGNVSHTAQYIGGGDQSIIEYTIGGCQKNPLSNYLKPYYKITIRRIEGITVEQAEKMKNEGFKDISKKRKYDYLSYVGFIFMTLKKKLGFKDAQTQDNPVQGEGLVCSTGYTNWAQLAGIELFDNIGDESVTPQDLLLCQKMKTIIEI